MLASAYYVGVHVFDILVLLLADQSRAVHVGTALERVYAQNGIAPAVSRTRA